MFALIRNLIGRSNRNTVRHSGSLMTSSLAAAPTLPQSRGVSTIPTPCPAEIPATNRVAAAASATEPASVEAGGAAPVEGDAVTLALAPIIARFPAELQTVLIARPSKNATVTLPLSFILQQLATGAVRVPLGYLRHSSSEPCFASTHQFDATPVALPLEEVLARIAPAQLPRRAQHAVNVPDSVTAPFGAGSAVAHAPAPTAPTVPVQPAAAPEFAEAPAVAAVPEAVLAAPAPIPMPALNPDLQAQRAARAAMPTRPIPAASTPAPAKTVPLPGLSKHAAVALPQRAVAPLPPDSIPSPFAVPPPPLNTAAPASPMHEAPPAAALAPAPRTETSFFRSGCLSLPITRLATGWPAPVLQELANQNLAAENVELPLEEIEAGLKQGRLAFTWRQIRAWTASVPKPLQESPLDSTALELPLRFVAPLFLSKRPMEQRQRASVGEGIPNIFGPGSAAFENSSFEKDDANQASGPAAPAAPAPVVTSPVSIPAPVAAAAGTDTQFARRVETAAASAPAPAAPVTQTSFLRRTVDAILDDPGKNNWPPMEIVRKISRMKGVAGATLATQDGLLVAEQYPALVGVDTFCALTTQLFNRVFSTAMELRLGGPARVSFVAESATYEIYRCGRLFLTVVSQPGEKLPSHDLVVIAEHLINQSR